MSTDDQMTPASEDVPQPAAGGENADGAVVLVVDDLEPRNRKLMDAVLSPRGFLACKDGRVRQGRGRPALGGDLPDIVLLDIQMPGTTGYETCRRIRADGERTAYLPVVMVTASGGEQKVRAIEAGADDFVTKPFRPIRAGSRRVRSLIRIKRYHGKHHRACRRPKPRRGTANSRT